MQWMYCNQLLLMHQRIGPMKKTIKIGTRGSKLALWQANHVKDRIEDQFPETEVEIMTIKTTGDMIVDRPLSMVGGKGLFVKEIEKALLESTIDMAVHSMKDMPGELPPGLVIGAVPARENPFDVLISNNNLSLADLPKGARIGTSSLRRASQIKHARPDIETASIRGNLDTRLKKLAAGEFDATLLAAAGLIRLGMKTVITQYFDETIMIPAVGQGALCIESRQEDLDIAPVLAFLNHGETHTVVSGERAFLRRLDGSCHIPVACFGRLEDHRVILTGLVASEDGRTILKETVAGTPEDPQKAGIALAETLLSKGADKILENLNS
ncbi:HemC [Desulforapulum autotrophicum HRM2]|uniref:Porphobilinogen deaminase n=2 Tax=Desulforapulum autotrophicum TaxID=2296 RepID=C0Q9U2_DESAH|nr:HemC [Desulforapulum autotrophicum HRM2]